MLPAYFHSKCIHLLPKLTLGLQVCLFDPVKALIEGFVGPLALGLEVPMLKAHCSKAVLQLLDSHKKLSLFILTLIRFLLEPCLLSSCHRGNFLSKSSCESEPFHVQFLDICLEGRLKLLHLAFDAHIDVLEPLSHVVKLESNGCVIL